MTAPAPAPKTPAVGDILSAGWGYEQTRYDFYQVVAVTKASVKIRKINKTYVTQSGGGYATVMPVKDSFAAEENTMTKRVKSWSDGRYAVRIASYSHASLWDGKPESESGDY
jgi:hypothetical protein